TSELIAVSEGFEQIDTPDEYAGARPLQVRLVEGGTTDAAHAGPAGVVAARAPHARVRGEPPVRALDLSRSDPAIPTVHLDTRARPAWSPPARIARACARSFGFVRSPSAGRTRPSRPSTSTRGTDPQPVLSRPATRKSLCRSGTPGTSRGRDPASTSCRTARG